MKNIRMRSYKDTGTILVDDGLITVDRLREATDVQQRAGLSLGRALVELGFVSEWELARAVAKEMGVPFIRLRKMEYRSAASLQLDPALLHHHRCFILEQFDGVDTVVVTEPPSLDLLTELMPILGDKMFLLVSLMSDVDRVLTQSIPLIESSHPANAGGATADEILQGFAK